MPPRSPNGKGDFRWLGILLLVCLVLYAVPVWWGLPSKRGWAFDEILPLQVLNAKEWPAKYPPFHRYLLRIFYIPFELAGALGHWSDSELYLVLFLVGRCLSVLMATATVYLVYRSARLLWDYQRSVLTAASAGFAIPLAYYGKTVNLEVPYLFWFAASLFFFLRILRRHRLRDYLCFATAATLSVCTKDQALGLYILAPLAIVASLRSSSRRQEPASDRPLRALLVTRLAAAVVTALLLVVFIYQGGPANESFWRHLRVMTSERMVGQYRIYPPTLVGQFELAEDALFHFAAALGPLLSVAALAGLVMAVRRAKENTPLLSLLLFPASYYLSFIAVIGYHYVRFFLPIALVCSFFAGSGLFALLRSRWLPLLVRRAVVGLTLALSFGWAAAVDVAMLGDARYAAERWLAEVGKDRRVVGIGRKKRLPRGYGALPWRRLKTEPCSRLEELNADLVVINPDDIRGEMEATTLRRFEAEIFGYQEAQRFENQLFAGYLQLPGVLWNLGTIGSPVIAFEKGSGVCLDTSEIHRLIEQLQHQREAIDRGLLARVILENGVVEVSPLRGREMVAVGLSRDHWTRETRPVAVAVRNRGNVALRPGLRVATGSTPDAVPITLFVDDGRDIAEHILDRAGVRTVPLPQVGPGDYMLFVLWTDRAWTPGPQDRRWLGVRLRSSRSPGES